MVLLYFYHQNCWPWYSGRQAFGSYACKYSGSDCLLGSRWWCLLIWTLWGGSLWVGPGCIWRMKGSEVGRVDLFCTIFWKIFWSCRTIGLLPRKSTTRAWTVKLTLSLCPFFPFRGCSAPPLHYRCFLLLSNRYIAVCWLSRPQSKITFRALVPCDPPNRILELCLRT